MTTPTTSSKTRIDHLAVAKRVIDDEIAEIHRLKTQAIDVAFSAACDLILKRRGRLVVIGMGKSGHIGRKISATLSSTGSPSFFVHPGEANHGDMGMITSDDTALLLSNSGETAEILSLLTTLKRRNVPIIAMTGHPKSTLGRASDICLNIGVTKEACALGLAPTSSTTTTLVLGDALAIALLEARGFTKEDFALCHPGGSLGKKLLLTVADVMHAGQEIPSVYADCTVHTALLEMTSKRLGATIVLDNNDAMIGIFTDGDLRRAISSNAALNNTAVRDVMTPSPITTSPETLAVALVHLMQSHQITVIPVCDTNHQVVGIVHMHYLLNAGVI